MTEYSWPWSTVTALGDGAVTLSEALSREFLAVYFKVQNPAVEGVSKGVGGELAVSGAATPLTVQAGSGVCYGLYKNDAAKTLAVTSPAVGTTGGRVVLQTNWAGTGGAGLEARTRLAVKKSADGSPAIPALTQTVGVTWEISLATFTITTGGVISVTDDRTFRKATAVSSTAELANLAVTTAKIALLNITTALINDLAVTTGKLAANAVTAAKMFQLAGLSILGRSANTTGDMAAITGTDGQALRVSGTSLGFGTLVAAAYGALSVGTAALADLGVTSGKLAALSVIAGKIADGAVDTAARLAANVVTTAKILDANVTTAKLALLSVTTAVINDLAVTTGKLADLAVTTAKLALNSVDDTIVGNRVPQFYRRQGGSATNWHTAGATNQTPTTVRMQGGAIRWTGAVDQIGSVAVTFPVAFSDAPIVVLTSQLNYAYCWTTSVTAAGFVAHWYVPAGAATQWDIDWLAVGPE